MKRIIIIGSGGSGKSTLARQLGEILKIEVLYLDKLYWQAGWVQPPKDEWNKRVEKFLQADSWIMDGNFNSTMELRIKAADTIIFLDLPRIICIYRAFKRWKKYWNTNRPDMAEGCNEKVDFEFLYWIWNFPNDDKLLIEERLKSFGNGKNIIRLKSPKEVDQFISNVKQMQ